MTTQDDFKDSEEGKELAPNETQESEEQEEKETPSEESSTEEKPESTEGEESKEVDEALSKESKGLEAEEEKLKAENAERRNRIVELRGERRTQKDELGDSQRNVQPKQESNDTDNSYDNSANYVIGEFVKEHPEYNADSESGDTKWAELFRESELSENRPQNPFDVKKRLEKAHAYIKSQNPTLKVDPAEENARKENLKLAGQGGGGSGNTVPSKKYTSSDLKIFTDMGYTRKEATEMAIRKKAR